MSYSHQNEFERIKREYEQVVVLLTAFAKKDLKAKTTQKGKLTVISSLDPHLIQAALATANDAYALLLIATSERFMRTYIVSLGMSLGLEPKYSGLIDKCRKEFNKTDPKIPIRIADAREVHDLREQRNAYAHGYGSNAFSTVGRVVTILGKFFAHLP